MRQTLKTSSSMTCFMLFMHILIHVRCDNCEFTVENFIERSKAFLGDRFWSSMTNDVTDCAVTCIRRKQCFAFNYDMDSRLCDLTQENSYPSQVSSKMKVFSRISAWPSQVDPDCYDRPCNDEEVCIPGSLDDGGTCSYICLAMPARCPLIKGIESYGPRTVGSTLTFTCDVGYRGGSSATCLSSLQWDKPLDTTCTPIYQSDCATTEDCLDINGECLGSKCVCPDEFVYQASETKCLFDCEDWVKFENSCYKFEAATMTFNEAEAFCNGNNAHLVQVDSREENDFITKILRNATHTILKGAIRASYWNDLFQFGEDIESMKWKTSGDEFNNDVADWHPGEPNHAKEKCTLFYQQYDFKWNDISCEKANRPICEKQQSLT